jgi:hypothetical protein
MLGTSFKHAGLATLNLRQTSTFSTAILASVEQCQNNALVLGFQVLGPGWAAMTQKCGSWTVPMA